MKKLIDNGHLEKVPDEELKGVPGRCFFSDAPGRLPLGEGKGASSL